MDVSHVEKTTLKERTITMVKTKAEILTAIKAKIGESTEDADLALLEDISDTFDDMSNRVEQAGDWKTKYEENDKAWKAKYRDRFFNPDADKEIEQKLTEDKHEKEEPKKLTFDGLFAKPENNNTESEVK